MSDPSANPASNRRRDVRVTLLLKVSYPDADAFLNDYTENISRGGAFIATDKTLAVGDTIRCVISFPGLMKPMPVSGTVTWRREQPDDEGGVGVGVEFDLDASDAVQRLNQFAREIEDAALGAQLVAGGDDAPPPVADEVETYTVLVADRNPLVHEFLRYGVDKLSLARYRLVGAVGVGVATRGAEAWARLEGGAIQLLVVDVDLDDGRGHELIERVRRDAQQRQMPVLAVGEAGTDGRRRALMAGADVYLDKPVKLNGLVTTLGTLLALAKRRGLAGG